MLKVGILGAGQLGRMLLQEAYNYPVEVHVMDKDHTYPAAGLCASFQMGDIQSYEDVVRFGSGLDVLTIEIEHVNLDALYALESSGVRAIFPIWHIVPESEFFSFLRCEPLALLSFPSS